MARAILLPLCLLVAALPGQAQSRALRGGIQLGLSYASGQGDTLYTTGGVIYVFKGSSFEARPSDFTGSSAAFLFGAHAMYDFHGGHTLRLRVEDSRASGTTRDTLGVSYASSVSTLGLMLDYQFHLTGRADGLFLLAGAGYERSSIQIRNPATATFDESGNSPAWALGAGFQSRDTVGFEFRYASSHPDGFVYKGLPFRLKNDRVEAILSFSF